MSSSFYIPIHSMNLAHYLASGIIVPSMYIENKNTDIQDRFRNYLLMSTSKFTKNTNCAIEIILDSEKEKPKKISENFYLLNEPLPISRIKNIYFTNEEQKLSTNFNITSGAAFIPEKLLNVSKEEYIDIDELNDVIDQLPEKKWDENLKKYDQILGGFSVMRVSKEKFQNYPTHYFSTLGNINRLFSDFLEKQNINIKSSFKFAFTNEGQFKNFHDTIYSEIDYNELKRYADNEKDKIKLEVKNGLVQLNNISENTNTYLVAILERYGKGKRMQNDSFISDLISDKFFQNIDEGEKSKKKEGLSLIFGLNKGYKAFRNRYRTSNFEIDVKLHLNSRLDYYIIESIYQYVFNSTNDISSFKYIDNLFPSNNIEQIKTSNYVTYQILDKTIIWKKRVLSPLEILLSKISQKVSDWFPSFVDVKKNEIGVLFRSEIEEFKNALEDEINNQYKLEIENLKNAILDKEEIIENLKYQVQKKASIKSEIDVNLDVDKNNYKSSTFEVKEKELLDDQQPNLDFGFNNVDKMTREQLEKLSMYKLKTKAKELKIPKYSTYKKNTDLINEILKLDNY